LAIIVSVVSIVITVLLVILQTYVYSLTKSEAISADRLHYLSDVTLNIGVLVALALSYYGYMWADGLFASLIGLFIMKGAYEIGFRAVQTLLDKSLGKNSLKKIIKAIHSVGEVKSIHDLKTHRAGPMVYIQGHLVLDGNMNLFKAHDIVDEIEKKIRIDFPDAEIILHMEPDTQSTYEDVVFFDSAEDKTE
ncbi:MAG: cation diffusion facilitator family transporter, partial [Lachnospiraceae bacterium]|nr:cation diffusion facilitator family transporter [Lachnospiraceae bacterium]